MSDLIRQARTAAAPLSPAIYGDSLTRSHHRRLFDQLADEIERLQFPWQDISTAPRDGTAVLLCCGDYIKIGSFFSYRNRPDWYDDSFDWLGGVCAPTAWMPLPTPPEDRTTGGER